MTRKWAKVGVTPEAHNLRVVDLNTGEEFKTVVEVDADAGWLVRFVTDEKGYIVVDGDEVTTERVEGLNLRIDIDLSKFGDVDFPAAHEWRKWNPDDTADGITELHKLPTVASPPRSEDAA